MVVVSTYIPGTGVSGRPEDGPEATFLYVLASPFTKTMISPTDPFIPLLIVCGLAFVIPFIAARFPYFELPVIVAEIIAGIIIGNSGLGIIPMALENISPGTHMSEVLSGQWLELLSLFGFAYLMFLSGIEIDFTMVKPTRIVMEKGKVLASVARDPLYLGIIYFILSLLLCYIAAGFLYFLGLVNNAFLMALVLTTTSVGVVVPTLRQGRVMRSEFGQNILLASLVADFSTMLLVTVAFASITTGVSPSLLIIGFLFVAFFAIYKMGHLIRDRPRIKKAIFQKISKTAEIRVRGAFALMLLFIVMAEILGAEVILGAFLAGAVVSLVTTRKETKALKEKLDGAGYGFFIPIFFIMVGVRFDLHALLETPTTVVLAPLLIVVAFTVKMVPAHIFTRRYGAKRAVMAGVLMSSRLSLIVAVAAIALDIGALTPALNSAIILVAVVTSTVSPAIFIKLARGMKRRRKDGRKGKGKGKGKAKKRGRVSHRHAAAD